MNDTEVQNDLRDYYGSIAPGDSVRATKLVASSIRERRGKGAASHSPRPRMLIGIAAAVAIALVAAVGFAVWRNGPNSVLPGGPAATASPTASAPNPSTSSSPLAAASASPTANPTATPSPRPSPTLRAATSATPAGHFSPTGSMDKPYGTATLLADGRVLMTGAYTRQTIDNHGVLVYSTAAELYDPATGAFTPTGSMIQAQGGAAVTRLKDGRILFAGGVQYSIDAGKLVLTRLATAELYDPTTGTFTATGSMTHPRLDHVATLLDSGEVLIAGGDGNAPDTDSTAELFDPVTGTFKPTGDMTTGRALAMSTPLADGRVLILGGTANTVLLSAEIYDPKTGTFSATGSMTTLRLFYTVTLLQDGRVLIAGNSQDSSASSAELYDPATGRFTPTGSFITDRGGQSATLLTDGRVLIAGGVISQGGYVWPRSAAAGVEAASRSGGAATIAVRFDSSLALPTDVPGILGATAPGTTFASAELYDPKTGKFVLTGSMGTPRAAHNATLLLDGRVLITGGDKTGLTAELYQP
jgi:large repetitive protein